MRAVTLCGAGGIGKTRLALRAARRAGRRLPRRGLVRRARRPAAARTGRVAGRVGHRRGRGAGPAAARDAGRRAPAAPAAAGPGQLRAPDRRLRPPVPAAAGRRRRGCRCSRPAASRCGWPPRPSGRCRRWPCRRPAWPAAPERAVPLRRDPAVRRPGRGRRCPASRSSRPTCPPWPRSAGRWTALPLAIELAAAWVRVLSVEQIAARLDDRFRLLTSGDRTAPPRQQTLRAAIDWSYDLLSDREQVLLRRLSVFAGWSLEMAEQVCADDDLPAADILDLLTALADKSLVEVEPEALRPGQVPDARRPIREYAAARLAEAGETAMMRRRLREYALRESEQPDAHRHGAGPGPVVGARGRLPPVRRRGRATCGEVLSALPGRGRRRDRAADLHGDARRSGSCAARSPRAPSGSTRSSASTRRRCRTRCGAGPGRAGSARPGQRLRRPLQARAAAGLELCRAAGEEFWTAAALNLLTEIALHAGQRRRGRGPRPTRPSRWPGRPATGGTRATPSAPWRPWPGCAATCARPQRLGEDALAIMRDIDQQWGAARTLLGLGDLARLRGDPGGAQRRYLEALAILREVNARPEIARCLAGLGRIAIDQGDLALGPAAPGREPAAELRLRQPDRHGPRAGGLRHRSPSLERRPEQAVQLAARGGRAARRRPTCRRCPARGPQRYLDAAARPGRSEAVAAAVGRRARP